MAAMPDPRAVHPRRALGAALVALVAAVSLVACGSSSPGAGSASTAAPATTAAPGSTEPVVKEVLAEDTAPPGAPGYTLTLIRYTIAPGAKLSPHVHPGVQMANIDSGSLTYTIISGTAEVRRAGGTPTAITGPTTLTLAAGDSVVEPFDMVHFGANDTDQPVVISATLLTESSQGLSVAVSTTTTAAP